MGGAVLNEGSLEEGQSLGGDGISFTALRLLLSEGKFFLGDCEIVALCLGVLLPSSGVSS